MTPDRIALALAVAVAGVAVTSPARAADRPERGRETVQRSFAMAGAGPHRLEIDNVFGSVRVGTHAADTIEVSATRITLAQTEADAALAAREVTLEVTGDAGTVRAHVDGPFRDCQEGRRRSGARRDYTVRFDFVVRVPRDTAVTLRTVTDGDVELDGVAGGFDVENVNGAIRVHDVAGAGRAHTVNGEVRVAFRENPPAASSFASVNGDIVVTLRRGLAADLRLKTFNGGVYTDFEVSPLPSRFPAGERRNGRFVYRGDRGFAARVGAGGPELSFDAFNGDIRILQDGR